MDSDSHSVVAVVNGLVCHRPAFCPLFQSLLHQLIRAIAAPEVTSATEELLAALDRDAAVHNDKLNAISDEFAQEHCPEVRAAERWV